MITIQIQPSCEKSFSVNGNYLHPNSTVIITQEEYDSIDPYWKQHVRILSRDDITSNINTVSGIGFNTSADICVLFNGSNDDDGTCEHNNSEILENIELNRTDLINLINKKPKTSNKKT